MESNNWKQLMRFWLQVNVCYCLLPACQKAPYCGLGYLLKKTRSDWIYPVKSRIRLGFCKCLGNRRTTFGWTVFEVINMPVRALVVGCSGSPPHSLFRYLTYWQLTKNPPLPNPNIYNCFPRTWTGLHAVLIALVSKYICHQIHCTTAMSSNIMKWTVGKVSRSDFPWSQLTSAI